MISTVDVKTTLENLQAAETITLSDTSPSTLELLSYGFCCALQGLVGLAYLALITLVPITIQQGMWLK
jgi:hypothetical protein